MSRDEDANGRVDVVEKIMKRFKISLRPADIGDAEIFYNLFARVQQLHLETEPAFFRRPEQDQAFDAYFTGLLKDPKQHLIICCDEQVAIGYYNIT
jgi:hypothetical protein